MMNVPLAIVAAIAENGVIGDGRGLPWYLPSDLKHFREITMGKPLLMGRKTFEFNWACPAWAGDNRCHPRPNLRPNACP